MCEMIDKQKKSVNFAAETAGEASVSCTLHVGVFITVQWGDFRRGGDFGQILNKNF